MAEVEPRTGLELILEDIVRRVVREELNGNALGGELLDAKELAAKLNVPKSWVREQSRQGNIPTRRLGHYVRFDLTEVLEATKKKETTP